MPQPTTLSGFLILIGLLLFLIGGRFIAISGVRVAEAHWKRMVVVALGALLMTAGGSISYRVWHMNRDSAILTPGPDCERIHIPEPAFGYPQLEPNPIALPND